MQGSIKKNISKRNSNQQNLVIGKATTKTSWIEWFSPLTTIIGNLLQITFTHHQRDDKKFFCRKREKRRKLLSGKGELRWGSYVSRFINDRLHAEMFSVRWTTSHGRHTGQKIQFWKSPDFNRIVFWKIRWEERQNVLPHSKTNWKRWIDSFARIISYFISRS